MENAPHLGTPPGNDPPPPTMLSPNKDLLFNSWGFATQALPHDTRFIWIWPPALPIPGALSPGPPILSLCHKGFGNLLSALEWLRL
jgi:hypothetical protein